MGVMVLHLDERQALRVRPLRRQVLGMEVAGDRGGLDAEHLEVEREVGAEGVEGRLAVEVAEVGGEERLARRGRRRTCSSARPPRPRSARRAGSGRASGPGAWPRERRTGNAERTTESSQRRWIGRSWERKASAIPARRRSRVGVVDRDGLVGAVAARHHERPRNVVAEQVVERGVREHQPDPRRRPGDRRRRPARPPRPARARSAARRASAAPPPPASAPRARSGSVGHHRERLLLAELARAQTRDGALVGRVARQVVAAEALHREDAAAARARRRPPRAASSGAARTRGRRSARRGSAGRRDPRTRAGSRRRAGSRPSSCAGGRRGPR